MIVGNDGVRLRAYTSNVLLCLASGKRVKFSLRSAGLQVDKFFLRCILRASWDVTFVPT